MEHVGPERERRPPLEDAKKKATGRSSSAPPSERTDLTPQERWEAARREFVRAAIVDAQAYTEMMVEDIVDKYRREGKLHMYDPDTEWMKRFARVVRKHPPLEGLVPKMEDYLALLEEDEAN